MTSLANILNFMPFVFMNKKADSLFFLITTALYCFGIWGIFRKCGLPGWHALFPVLREIRLGEASGMEKVGLKAAVLQAVLVLIGIVGALAPKLFSGDLSSYVTALRLILALYLFVYLARIQLNLCVVFGRKKHWILLWVVFSWIPAIMWGWMKKYQPQWKPEEIKRLADSYFSGSKAAVLDQELTINLDSIFAGRIRCFPNPETRVNSFLICFCLSPVYR